MTGCVSPVVQGRFHAAMDEGLGQLGDHEGFKDGAPERMVAKHFGAANAEQITDKTGVGPTNVKIGIFAAEAWITAVSARFIILYLLIYQEIMSKLKSIFIFDTTVHSATRPRPLSRPHDRLCV